LGAYQWLCKARTKYLSSADIWDFRRSWYNCAKVLVNDFARGSYGFTIQKKTTLSCAETIALWSSRDALVVKVLTSHHTEKAETIFF
jgi:RNA-directed DNA polymerase